MASARPGGPDRPSMLPERPAFARRACCTWGRSASDHEEPRRERSLRETPRHRMGTSIATSAKLAETASQRRRKHEQMRNVRALTATWVAAALLSSASSGQLLRRLADINQHPVVTSSNPRPQQDTSGGTLTRDYVTIGAWSYFSASGPQGTELYRTSGKGASLVRDIVPGPVGSNPSKLTAVGSTLYFVAKTPAQRPARALNAI